MHSNTGNAVCLDEGWRPGTACERKDSLAVISVDRFPAIFSHGFKGHHTVCACAKVAIESEFPNMSNRTRNVLPQSSLT